MVHTSSVLVCCSLCCASLATQVPHELCTICTPSEGRYGSCVLRAAACIDQLWQPEALSIHSRNAMYLVCPARCRTLYCGSYQTAHGHRTHSFLNVLMFFVSWILLCTALVAARSSSGICPSSSQLAHELQGYALCTELKRVCVDHSAYVLFDHPDDQPLPLPPRLSAWNWPGGSLGNGDKLAKGYDFPYDAPYIQRCACVHCAPCAHCACMAAHGL